MIVYLASNRLTRKAYVGKTRRTLEQRWREHCQVARSGGEGVKGLVHTPETRARMSEARRGEKNVNFGKLFGINLRGWTDEEKARLSEQRLGSGNPMSGRHHSDEAKQRIGAATSIRKRKLVAQVSKEGTVLCVYPSLQEAATTVGGQANKISEVLCGHRRTHKGYVWQYILDSGNAADGVEV